MYSYTALALILIFSYGICIQKVQASGIDKVPQDIKEEIFDKWKFKDLREHSLISKEHYAQVLGYFQHRLTKVKATACPVLTQAWIQENLDKEFPQGLPSYHEPVRSLESQKGSIASVNGINWNITVLHYNADGAIKSGPFGKEDLGSEDLKPLEEETQDILGTSGVAKALKAEGLDAPVEEGDKFGPMVNKYCIYYKDNKKTDVGTVQIRLNISDEFLELPELGIKGELIG